MDNVLLRFGKAANTTLPIRIIFGETDTTEVVTPDPVTVTGTGVMTANLFGSAEVIYDTRTQRPVTCELLDRFQRAQPLPNPTTVSQWRQAQPLSHENLPQWQRAKKLQSELTAVWRDSLRTVRPELLVAYQEALKLSPAELLIRFQKSQALARETFGAFQRAQKVDSRVTDVRYQEAIKVRSNLEEAFQRALGLRNGVISGASSADRLRHAIDVQWQYAIKPGPGRYIPPVIPEPEDPCYIPELPVRLIFSEPWIGDHPVRLAFICDRHGQNPEPPAGIVIPVRRVYYMFNSAYLYRMPGSIPIRAKNMSIGLDVDSWTYTFSANIDAKFMGALEPNVDGSPTELQALINGTLYRFVIRGRKRNRTFPDTTFSVTGQGLSSVLSEIDAAKRYFTNTNQRTANQLMADALTDNGVGIGWDVEFNMDDWLVPANAWAFSGTYMDALKAIAGAAGGYIQPHPSDAKVRALLRYPTPPWEWTGVTPDIELPVEFTSVEDIDWIEKPVYNRVFVAGTNEYGIIRDVKRDGFAGDLVAEMVSDQLVTAVNAARQLGQSILSDVGKQAHVTVRTPLWPGVGIIHPGKMIKYVDNGIDRIGISRAVSVDVTFPEIWQTVEIETHVAP